MKILIEDRTQSPRGTWPKCGPNRYIAVQVVPDGVEPLKILRRDWAAKRGIKIIRCGDYYHDRVGPRSSYAAARDEALRVAKAVNNGEEV